jgi:hypothetical protein
VPTTGADSSRARNKIVSANYTLGAKNGLTPSLIDQKSREGDFAETVRSVFNAPPAFLAEGGRFAAAARLKWLATLRSQVIV